MSLKQLSTLAARAAVTYTRNAPLQTRQVLNVGRMSPRWQTTRQIPAVVIPARFHSSESSKSKVYDFNAVKALSEAPSNERILIDVREPQEYEAGYIPNALNIPIASSPDALFMPAHEFEDKFGFPKPEADQEVIFYCKAGVRSSAAAQLAQQVGYKNVAEYRGSWLDWQKQGGKTEKW